MSVYGENNVLHKILVTNLGLVNILRASGFSYSLARWTIKNVQLLQDWFLIAVLMVKVTVRVEIFREYHLNESHRGWVRRGRGGEVLLHQVTNLVCPVNIF